MDALARLQQSVNQPQSDYSLDEQIESASDFFDGMSAQSKEALFSSIKEETVADTQVVEEVFVDNTVENDTVITDDIVEDTQIVEDTTPIVDEKMEETTMVNEITEEEEVPMSSENEVLFNNNSSDEKKSNRGRKRKTETESVACATIPTPSYNPIMDQLAKDLIDQLRSKNYKMSRFDDTTMGILFSYMYEKFN